MIIKVKSETNPNTTYAVTINNGVATGCTCPSARWHSGLCKHARKLNSDQAEVTYLAWRGRHQVDGGANIALLTDIYKVVRQGPASRPTAAQVAGLARIVDNIDERREGDVERRVLGGLLAALTVDSVHALTAA